MQDIMLLINFLLCFFLFISMSEEADEGYLRVKCDASEGPEVINQGRPGKVGPAGLPGQKGEQGARGPQGEGVGELVEKVRQLTDNAKRMERYTTTTTYKVEYCSVGMKVGGSLENDQITASSEWDGRHAGYIGRLDNVRTREAEGIWAPRAGRTIREWVQVNFRNPTQVTGVVTQGRPQHALDWVTEYVIQYGNSTSSLQTIEGNDGNDKVFDGNTDRNSYALNHFPQPITARYFRLVVRAYHLGVALRMDYVTC